MKGVSDSPGLAVYESVRCLECGTVYGKPSRGGTSSLNPGCPKCGYVGWMTVDVPVRRPDAQPRSDADQPLDRSVRSH